MWRFCVYRDSGPTLILDRLQQVEQEAYLTLMAGRAGVSAPDVLAAGRFGPSKDAALVTRVPDGVALAQADGAGLDDAALDQILRAVLRLRAAGIAHGVLGGDTIIVSDQGISRPGADIVLARIFAPTPPGRLSSRPPSAAGSTKTAWATSRGSTAGSGSPLRASSCAAQHQ